MLHRLRENLLLKIISLVASVLLWFYVQVERPPSLMRTVFARVVPQGAPPNVDIQNLPQQLPVSVVGPVASVERLKNGDIQALVDLHNVRSDQPGPAYAQVTLVLPDWARNVTYDSPPPIKVQANPQQQRQMAVVPLYPKEPPAGFHYGRPEVRPRVVTITGRADRLNQVDRLVVLAAPPEFGAPIEGDFPVQARDGDNDVVDGVKVEPEKVHVAVPLIEEPSAKIVTISPTIIDQPEPPYVLKSITVRPNQIKLTGRPERLNQLFTVPTEDIPTRNLTGDQKIEANLNIPPDVTAFDLEGRRLTRVTVSVEVRKIGESSPSMTPQPSPPPTEIQTPKP
ncbi:MAG TPA: CdaR family protein [Chthonomonadaceae bacterium]|nr:CdaR family protein [Chthonomonadaceae bacterium]